MTKAELVTRIYQQTDRTKTEVETTLDTMFEVIKDSLSQHKTIYVRGFGNFQNKQRAKRTARNVKRNTLVEVEAHKYPTFKPSKIFIEEVKKSLLATSL
ncbi:MAG TPA: integration host factor subunit beta [Runella sp.]|nr:integration host factor subunit beta [Runella sp.]HAO51014.1 integration host factor subunit beta [Runella sp.]